MVRQYHTKMNVDAKEFVSNGNQNWTMVQLVHKNNETTTVEGEEELLDDGMKVVRLRGLKLVVCCRKESYSTQHSFPLDCFDYLTWAVLRIPPIRDATARPRSRATHQTKPSERSWGGILSGSLPLPGAATSAKSLQLVGSC